MTSRLEKLLIRVELIDKLTGPANKVASAFDKMTNRVSAGYAKIVGGTAGIWGVGVALNAITSDARDMHRAIGEVASLGVTDAALKQLEKTSLKFSIQYGESAADFVRSSYDIQSAISGLAGKELAKFTEAGGVLAKGTKSSTATITNYMGTMYGIFQKNADAMGKSQWVEQLTGQTALAVQMFKTTGDKVSQAFGTLGADAAAMGIPMNEQMAVLGKLQATMEGGEAGSKYKALLRGVGSAQKELNMVFTDSAGKILPIDKILAKLHKKYGDLDTVAKGDLLKKAFGSDEAVTTLKLLMNDTTGLAKAMDDLGNVTGMDLARQMADKMVDQLDRMNAANVALKISFGNLMGKALSPFYENVTKSLVQLQKWVEMFPNLSGAIANITILIFGFAAAVSLLAIAKGVWIVAATGVNTALALLRLTLLPFGPLLTAIRMAWLVFNMQLAAGTGVMAAMRAALVAFRVQLVVNTMATWAMRAALWSYNAVVFMATTGMRLLRLGFAAARMTMLATALVYPALGAGMAAITTGFGAAATASWAFAAALLANPITWIVLGVVALGAGLVWLVTHWQEAKTAVVNFALAFVEKWQAFRAMIENNPVAKFLLQPLLLIVDAVAYVLGNLDKLPQWFDSFKKFLSSLNPFDLIGKGVDWLIEKLNMIPGVHIGTTGALGGAAGVGAQLDASIDRQRAAIAPTPSQRVSLNVPAGGISSQINNSNTNQGLTIGKVEVHASQPLNGKTLGDELRMLAP